jgi:hypothetical protein
MDTITALQQLRPGAQWSLPTDATSAEAIIWHDDTEPVTQQELDDMLAQPDPVLTTEQKLEAAGLTVAELRELFGLPAPEV